jgi:ABC-type ATPase with predicted acetyltransferase domain
MATFTCEKCGNVIDSRCKPKTCSQCGETGSMCKQENAPAAKKKTKK